MSTEGKAVSRSVVSFAVWASDDISSGLVEMNVKLNKETFSKVVSLIKVSSTLLRSVVDECEDSVVGSEGASSTDGLRVDDGGVSESRSRWRIAWGDGRCDRV